jgi:peptide/nickel transport system substrate-binding protein
MPRSLKYLSLSLVLLFASAPSHSETLTVAAASLPESLQAGLSTNVALNVGRQMMSGLVARNNAGETIPDLAERWEFVSDTTWRFHLRHDVKFQDGSAFTADDVKYTLDHALDPKNAYGMIGRISAITNVAVVDPLTVDISTAKPFPTLVVALADILIEPKLYAEKVGPEEQRRHPIGTGPFTFKSYVPGDRLNLVANPTYWRGKPKLDSVAFRLIPEASTRIASLLSGESQIAEEVPVDYIDQVDKNPNLKIDAVSTSVGLILTYDVTKPPFDNPKVREAMDLAVDKNLIRNEILKGKGEVLQGQLLTSNTFGFNPAIKARPFDIKKAKQLLAEAGYPNGFSTSISTMSGRYLSDVDIANAVSGMLNEIGVKVDINVMESGIFLKNLGSPARNLGPIYMIGWYSFGDADFAMTWFTQANKRTAWSNAEFDQLFSAARSTNDVEARKKDYARMAEIMHEENPSMFLFGLPTIYGVSKRVSGFSAPPDRVLRLNETVLK